MTNIYILTEHGNDYTDEGILCVKEEIKDLGITDELQFTTGRTLNKPKVLLELLKDDEPSVVMLSIPNRRIYFYEKNINALVEGLEEQIEEKGTDDFSVWDSLYVFIMSVDDQMREIHERKEKEKAQKNNATDTQ